MKNLILILTAIAFIASCGAPKMSKEDQAKQVIHQVDSLNSKLEGQANDYCKCLETKSTNDCQSIYVDLCTTYDSASAKTRDAAYGGLITKDEEQRLHKATAKQFDRKAACAKAAMRRDGN
jgi:hypothetical protein